MSRNAILECGLALLATGNRVHFWFSVWNISALPERIRAVWDCLHQTAYLCTIIRNVRCRCFGLDSDVSEVSEFPVSRAFSFGSCIRTVWTRPYHSDCFIEPNVAQTTIRSQNVPSYWIEGAIFCSLALLISYSPRPASVRTLESDSDPHTRIRWSDAHWFRVYGGSSRFLMLGL